VSTTHTTIDTPLGEFTLVAENGSLSGVYFPGHWTRPDRAAFGERSERGFEDVERQLAEYFSGDRTSFELPTAAGGDAFQRRVWALIAEIPYGQTTTYGEIARELGDPTLAREVGVAVARNPLSLIVPCHRVVGKNGELTGYAGGLRRKQFLLDLEGVPATPDRSEGSPGPALGLEVEGLEGDRPRSAHHTGRDGVVRVEDPALPGMVAGGPAKGAGEARLDLARVDHHRVPARRREGVGRVLRREGPACHRRSSRPA
jgi:methylated-DNA-[protein]-cysteine S-methyltransferase